MMHRCGASHGSNNLVGPCSCDVYQPNQSSFSMLFSKPYDQDHHQDYYHQQDADVYSYPGSGVDCTLSLGTPSTRLSNADDYQNDKRRSNFCWDLLQPKNYTSSNQKTSTKNSTRSSSNNYINNNNNNNNNSHGNTNSDSLLARRCANCDTTSTPLWRNGPRGPKSLCNACGIRFKKEERRATAAAAAPAPAPMDQSGHVYGQYHQYHNSNWNNYQNYPQPQKNMSGNCNEFRFMDNDDSGDNGISFLSWRLNVTDRPSLVHDFTR